VPEAIEEKIRATFDAFADAWNAHDVTRMVACWAEQGTAVDPWGRYAAGHEGVARLLGGEHEGSMRESSYRIDEVRVQALSERSAIAECECVIVDALAPNGKRYELRHRVDAVLVCEDDESWRFISLHPSFGRARG
jgi:uncharacterized protein (TIGR02246 family)